MIKKEGVAFIKLIVGNISLALAYSKWMVPNKLINGGVTSLSMVLGKLFNLPLLLLTNGLTFALLALCFLFLGKKSFAKSVLGSVIYSSLFSIMHMMEFSLSINFFFDFVLACVFIAIGYACCISAGASTVGLDVIALILHKRNANVNIAKSIRIGNYSVLLLGLFTFGVKAVITGVLFSFIYSVLLDKLLESTKITVFSHGYKKPELS